MKMAKLDKKAKDMLEQSEEYLIFTENGMSAGMSTSRMLSCVTWLLKTMKEDDSIDNDDIDKVCELAKTDNGIKGIVQLLEKLKELIEELDK